MPDFFSDLRYSPKYAANFNKTQWFDKFYVAVHYRWAWRKIFCTLRAVDLRQQM